MLGCRCAECRASNVHAYRARMARARVALRELVPAPPVTVSRVWLGPAGVRLRRVYHGCPGVEGAPCRWRSYLRKDVGPVCGRCRDRLVWNGLVDAARARAHLLALSRVGVGYKQVAAAADVSGTVVAKIRFGHRSKIRAATERAILAVDRDAVADHAIVPAGPTWKRIRWLLDEGFTRGRIAREALGVQRPALQIGRRRVLASTATKIERYWSRFQ